MANDVGAPLQAGAPKASTLMQGKKGLVMGVANDHSIAWGIARALAAHGADIAFSYLGEAEGKRVKPLAESIGSKIVVQADVQDDKSLDEAFAALKREWGGLDFLVHSIAGSNKNELRGRFSNISRANFHMALSISCYSFIEVARRAAALMTAPSGGAMLTLTYMGAERVVPSYNAMGVAKAALEASVRYLAADLGRDRIRVNAISSGPMRTLSGAVIGGSRFMYNWNRDHAALKRNVTLDELGGAALYLLSDLSSGVTGEIHYVDAGFSIIGLPRPEDVRSAATEGDNG